MIRGTLTHSPFVVRRRTAGNSFDLIARKETMSQTLLIPGIEALNPAKLFADGQPGGFLDPYDLTKMWVDDAGTTPATIASLGTGIGRVITKGHTPITLVQANAADRPVWGRHPVSGIRNLAIGTDLTTGAVSGTPGTPPTGWSAISTGGTITVTSQGLRLVTTDNSQRSFQQSIAVLANTTYSFSIVADITAPVGIHNTFVVFSGLPAGATVTRFQDGVGLTEFQNLSAATASVIRLNIVVGATAGTLNIRFGTRISSAGGTGNDITFRNFQVEVGTGRTTYQRVTNRFDITEVGSPSLYYFSGNGVNQSWSSNATVNFSGVNRFTIWAGLRRRGTAAGTIAILGPGGANTFSMRTNIGAVGDFTSSSAGTAGVVYTTNTNGALYPSPTTRAVVSEGSTVAPFARVWVDSQLIGSNTGAQSGFYSNGTLRVFVGTSGTDFLNADIYSLIVAGDNYDSRTIQRFSDWLLKPRRLITA